MPNLVQIARAIDYIEANLREAITVADMAGSVSYSLYHFCRTFNQITHHTPYDYLMRRRLSEAARALLQTDAKIVDVAFDYQFNNHETFSRAFKRLFAMQPSQWRVQGWPDSLRLMPCLTLAHIQHLAKGDYLKPVLAELPALQLAGLMAVVPESRKGIPELWDLFFREMERQGQDLQSAGCYGLATYPEGWQEDGYLYLAGAGVQALDAGGTALVVKPVPALRYGRFVHKGPMADLPLTLDYVYHTWLPKSGYRLSHRWVIEHYGPNADPAGGEGAETEIYVPVEPAAAAGAGP
jgi:AraC family transcriptional regulator